MSAPSFTLTRDAAGRLVFTADGGAPHAGVVPVRAFPLAAPNEGISIVGTDGRELAWIERLDILPAALRTLLDEEFAHREFVPRIERLLSVSSFSTPSTWTVDTDRGTTHFVLKAEEDIRALGAGRLLITSGDGLVFSVADATRLDRASKRLLERFL